MKIKGREIGAGHPAYLIAEMSANHAGSLSYAKEIIHAAKESGADCIKIQTYTPDTITIDCDNKYFQISDGTWNGENLYHLYERAYTPWEWQSELKAEADKVGIDFFSTPFDNTAVDFLEKIGVEFYKIASFELVDIPLIEYTASKGKPMIMSTGMASLAEIEEAVNAVYRQGNYNLALLRCASAYPAITDDMNLRTMQNMAETFGIPVGLSDHSMGSVGAVTAVALGANIIEKHFCLSREIENPDVSFSMNPAEFSQMVKDIRQAEKAVGMVKYGVTEQEKSSMVFRRSIFCVKDIKRGELLTKENVRVIRPGYGLAPKYFAEVIGQTALCDIERGTPLQFHMIGKDGYQKSNQIETTSLRVLFLTNNPNTMPLYNWLRTRCEIIKCSERLNIDFVREVQPDFIISYNYSYIISKEIIEYMQGKILNLHISLLPWNKGSSPNFWSFVDNTPKGVTIHQVSPGLDEGNIVYQRECFFDIQKETFETSYQKLNNAVIQLFQENWENIQSGNLIPISQSGVGSYHTLKDLLHVQEQCPFQWSDNIADFLKRYQTICFSNTKE